MIDSESPIDLACDVDSILRSIIDKTAAKVFETDDKLFVSYLDTTLGTLIIGATQKGICIVEFADKHLLAFEFETVSKLVGCPILQGENDHIISCKKQLIEYFASKRTAFDIALDTPGTSFQETVWKSLCHIPYGTTISYKKQSQQLGNEAAIRAMASANGQNRVAIIIPCHRVIGENGSLTGYSGGIWRKRWLLNFEKDTAQKLGLVEKTTLF